MKLENFRDKKRDKARHNEQENTIDLKDYYES